MRFKMWLENEFPWHTKPAELVCKLAKAVRAGAGEDELDEILDMYHYEYKDRAHEIIKALDSLDEKLPDEKMALLISAIELHFPQMKKQPPYPVDGYQKKLRQRFEKEPMEMTPII